MRRRNPFKKSSFGELQKLYNDLTPKQRKSGDPEVAQLVHMLQRKQAKLVGKLSVRERVDVLRDRLGTSKKQQRRTVGEPRTGHGAALDTLEVRRERRRKANIQRAAKVRIEGRRLRSERGGMTQRQANPCDRVGMPRPVSA